MGGDCVCGVCCLDPGAEELGLLMLPLVVCVDGATAAALLVEEMEELRLTGGGGF